jgi:RNA polymerase sigma factor (sigma-70 family)
VKPGVERADLLSRARAGDGDAFQELAEQYRRELQVHCYRMLGSFQDAEDALQDTFLTAWRGLGGFEGRASLRTWLYRIATNRCLNVRRSASRRPAQEWKVANVDPPEPTRLGEVVWLEPYPDVLLEGAIGAPLGPEARYEQTESISLAFVTALQVLPPRQLAVLILRDVLGFHADEVADMLDSSVDSVNSAVKRARATLQRRLSTTCDGEPPPSPTRPSRMRSSKSSYSHGSPPISMHWWAFSRTTSSSRCPRCRSNTRAEMSLPASAPAFSTRAEGSTSYRRGQMASRRSGHTCATLSASATGSAFTSSPSPATGSAQ